MISTSEIWFSSTSSLSEKTSTNRCTSYCCIYLQRARGLECRQFGVKRSASEDLRYVTRMLETMKTVNVHIHASCSSHRSVFWNKAWASHLREERLWIASDHEDLASKIKECETAEIRLVFEVKILALHYARALGNYQIPSDVRLAAHRLGVKMIIYIWRWGAKWVIFIFTQKADDTRWYLLISSGRESR